MSSGILDRTVTPNVVLPTTAAGFGPNGIDSQWAVSARCELFTAKTQVIAGAPILTCGSSISGSIDFGSRVLFGGVSKEAVYKIVVPPAPSQSAVTLDTCSGASIQTVINVYSGDGTAIIATNDNNPAACGGSATLSSVQFTPPLSGGTFLVSVESTVNTTTGTFTIAAVCGFTESPTTQSPTFPPPSSQPTTVQPTTPGQTWSPTPHPTTQLPTPATSQPPTPANSSKPISSGNGGGGGGGGGSLMVIVIAVVAVLLVGGIGYGLYKKRQAARPRMYAVVHANVAYEAEPKASAKDFGEEGPDDDDDALITVETDA